MPAPPATRRDDDQVDELHGHRIADPYRWLEDLDAPETRAWIGAQNAVTDAHLATFPHRAAVRDTVARLWDHPRRGVPFRRGERWFQLRNDGLQDQDVLWTAAGDGASAAPEDGWTVLLDPNTLSGDGTTSVTDLSPSHDGRLLAYALSEAGSDWMTFHVLDCASGAAVDAPIRWAKFTHATWLPGDVGFLYGAFDPPAGGEEFEAANRDQRLKRHLVGTSPDEDEVVHARPDQPEWMFHPAVTHDDRWLVLHVSHGTEPANRLHVAPLDPHGGIGEVRPLFDRLDARYESLGTVGDELWLRTDRDAPNGRVVAVDPTAGPEPALREVVAEREDRLEAAALVGGADGAGEGWLVLGYLHHAASRVEIRDLDGEHLRDVALPGLGSAGNAHAEDRFSGTREDDAFHIGFEDFTSPLRVLRHDLTTGETTEVSPPGLAGDERFVTERVFVTSGDVRVPVFVVRHASVEADGARPTVLWGYGGFDIPVVPHFRTAFRAWVELGGVLAVACLRGGGEYGKAWHDAGRLAAKQHVFDDAIAVAEWLTGSGEATTVDGAPVDAVWTAPEHLGLEGRSNGGLLVGAVMTQRPDLFGSCVPEVGVLDMLRFHEFTIGWAWISDYGDPREPDAFATLLAYSPLHNLRQGTAYPPTLVTTGDHDDRVVPGHSYKFAAALQHAQGGDAPALIRIDTSAGHGAGKPVGKLVDERSDVLAFHAHHLGLEVRRD